MTPKTEIVMPAETCQGFIARWCPWLCLHLSHHRSASLILAALPSAAAILAAVLPPLPEPPLPEEWMEKPAAALAAMEASE